MKITLKPFGPVDPATLEHIAKALRPFGEVAVAPPAPVPASAFVPKRNQYRASPFFPLCREEPGDRVLAVTPVDLFEDGLNFVFGYATMQDRYGIISTARLGPPATPAYGDRVAKEAVHEIGHTLGLDHDPNPACVMHFSSRLEDTDRKGLAFCATCTKAAGLTVRRLRK